MMQLVRYENAKRAIAEYKTVDDVKEFRDKAVAVQAYAKQANDYQLERDAAIARVRAERKCGELLRDMDKASGRRTDLEDNLVNNDDQVRKPKTLSELGVTKDQSSKWQKLADVPEDVFEGALADPGITVKGLSGAQILSIASPVETENKMNPSVIWLWGRLRDMERDGIFETPLSEYLSQMTDGMKPDADRIIPQLINWINEYEQSRPIGKSA